MRERRIVLGLTLQRVADELGTTHQQVQRYERGLHRVAAGRLLAIARALGVEPGHFFAGLGAAPTGRPAGTDRAMLGLAQDFLMLARRQQEALCELARALADAAPGPEETGEAA
jgi:transcriptional regulator with XRE-family HTH domain